MVISRFKFVIVLSPLSQIFACKEGDFILSKESKG